MCKISVTVGWLRSSFEFFEKIETPHFHTWFLWLAQFISRFLNKLYIKVAFLHRSFSFFNIWNNQEHKKEEHPTLVFLNEYYTYKAKTLANLAFQLYCYIGSFALHECNVEQVDILNSAWVKSGSIKYVFPFKQYFNVCS